MWICEKSKGNHSWPPTGRPVAVPPPTPAKKKSPLSSFYSICHGISLLASPCQVCRLCSPQAFCPLWGESRRKKAMTLCVHCSAIARIAVLPTLPVTPKTWDALKEVTSIPARLYVAKCIWKHKGQLLYLNFEGAHEWQDWKGKNLGIMSLLEFCWWERWEIPCSLTATARPQNSWNSKALNRGTLITERWMLSLSLVLFSTELWSVFLLHWQAFLDSADNFFN